MASPQATHVWVLCALSFQMCAWANRPPKSNTKLATSFVEETGEEQTTMKTADDAFGHESDAYMLFDLFDFDEDGHVSQYEVGAVSDMDGATFKAIFGVGWKKGDEEMGISKIEFVNKLMKMKTFKAKTQESLKFYPTMEVFNPEETEIDEGGAKKAPGDLSCKLVKDGKAYRKMKSLKFADEKNVVDMYEFFDVDGNGLVDPKEWAQRLMGLSELDGDWKLDADEILHHESNMIRFPTMAGVDGQLEKSEMESAQNTLLGGKSDYLNYAAADEKAE